MTAGAVCFRDKPMARAAVAAGLVALALSRGAAQELPNLYGEDISVEAARKAAAAAIAEGKKNGWRVAVAVVDTHGDLPTRFTVNVPPAPPPHSPCTSAEQAGPSGAMRSG